LERAQSAFLELSVPVVPLAKGMAILPLIGNIDTERANYLMEETLKSVNRLQLQRLILDLSGVYIIDTMVADRIFKVIDSLKLLGVETILTGIRPEVAQTIVSIGIDFSSLTIKSSLQKAIEDVLIHV
ncbi:MAG: STAS domain-containing protein, partial [Priestia megaterium]